MQRVAPCENRTNYLYVAWQPLRSHRTNRAVDCTCKFKHSISLKWLSYIYMSYQKHFVLERIIVIHVASTNQC
uniref:SFRICE_026693 n=1 Tax=Spodoptera frugiperda TaxID=7108 RepID=A0A2H1WS55_SPOFR